MQSQVCPFLGLVDERGAYLTYPSFENRCYAPPASEAIALNEQTFFCLGGNHERCPRFQARQAADASAPAPAAAEPPPYSPGWQPQDANGETAPTDALGEADGSWQFDEASDLPAADQAVGAGLYAAYTAPPPPPPGYGGGPGAAGGSRRPVWPLLLAAGTLVVTLVLCGFVSAAWFGLQTLSASLALRPTGTPLVEAGTPQPSALPFTGTVTADGYIIVVLTPSASLSGTVSPTATPTSTPSPSPTDTLVPFVPFDTPTPIPTIPGLETPDFRPTPTPRDTPTFAPTWTPAPTFTPFATFTPSPVPSATFESFVVRFVAEPASIQYGQFSTLTYEIRGVKAAYVNDDPVTGPVGSVRVQPTKTTTYVLRVIKVDNSVLEVTQTVTVSLPTPTATPTLTATPTATPYYQISFAENRNTALIDGSGCQTGNGCSVFQIQVVNLGNRPVDYRFEKLQNLPTGWSAVFCFDNGCEFSSLTRRRTLNANTLDTTSLNFLLPSGVRDEQTGSVTVKGYLCAPNQGSECLPVYSQDFTIIIDIPPTPQPTGTATPTSTSTPTSTPTPTATPTTALSAAN